VVWTGREAAAEIAVQAAALPGVEAVAFDRAGTIGLLGSRDAAGTPVDVLSDGFRIPVTVVAVDPAAYAATLTPGPAKDLVAGLEPGEALLSETGAELRRVGIGGELDLEGSAGLAIAGIVPDATVRRAEVIVHETDAEALGLRPPSTLVVRHAAEADDQLVAALAALLPPDRPARVVNPQADDAFYPPILSLVEIKARFGEFAYRPRDGVREIDVDPAFAKQYMVTEVVPLLGETRCHKAIMDDLRAAIDEVIDAGLGGWIDPAQFGGCHYPRRMSPTGGLSNHSWGIAVDINVDLSMPGLGPVPPEEFIEIFGRHGFRWGGDFTTPDNHHYEWVGPSAVHRPTG
jgi:hypothetical protein